MTVTVLVVCSANTCRSPMGEMILNAAFRRAGIDAIADSAGVGFVSEGDRILPPARAALENAGIPVYPHQARRLTPAMLEGYDLALTMTGRQADSLRQRYYTGVNSPEIHQWREFDPHPESGRDLPTPDVDDPWAAPGGSIYDTLDQLLGSVDGILDRVTHLAGP